MFDHEQIVAAEQAAINRLYHCFSELHGEDTDDAECECLGAFCGCETCIVREVFDAIMKVLDPQ